MRTTQCTYGSPEQNLGKVAMAQLARFYNVPIYSLGGGVEGKVPDAETAAEAMMSMLLNGLAGINLNQSLGSMAFGLYGSQEMVVICDELSHMIKHVLRGIVVDDDTLAVDVIREVGYGGSFLGADHTVRHFRKELYFPFLFQRKTIDQWLDGGSQDEPRDRARPGSGDPGQGRSGAAARVGGCGARAGAATTPSGRPSVSPGGNERT